MVTQNFYDSLKDAAQSAVCNYLNAADDAASWLGGVSGIYLSDPSQYWKPVLCDDDPASASNPVPVPFLGGQCDGTLYQITFFTETVSGGRSDFGPTTVAYRGPLTNAVGPNEGNGVIQRGFTWTRASGEKQYENFIQTTEAEFIGAGITGVVAVSGPDTCGDPEPEIPPFPDTGAPLPPQPTTYIDFGGNTVNISPEFTLFAPVVVGPNIFAPVRIDLPDVSIDGTLTLSPDFNLEINPFGGDGSPGTSDEPTVPEDPITSPNTPDDDSSETLIGVHVRSQEVGYNRQTQIDQGSSPTLVVARLGRVYFRVRMGGRLGWLRSEDIQHTSQYVPVPRGVYAVQARVTYEGGWTGEAIPVFGLPNSPAL